MFQRPGKIDNNHTAASHTEELLLIFANPVICLLITTPYLLFCTLSPNSLDYESFYGAGVIWIYLVTPFIIAAQLVMIAVSVYKKNTYWRHQLLSIVLTVVIGLAFLSGLAFGCFITV
ncbi:hypothetical protein [Thalassotalea agarivorans]|uniref:Uncharacterized protein n=1 Tax=Thalassotalea agarivorans TaxID=349064 RepID=A0A1H9YEQ8_THASX|nr:hypothetical protein [Thalassotalea agarivorans]SES67502.1 hypothetical protein SAMN05660429_00198 [Thalassotalea agarivorans]